jgi:two-component system, sensor histidine kinase
MNLRTRAIFLSLVPLIIVLLLALPEGILQWRVSTHAAQARRSELAAAAAADIGNGRVFILIALRRYLRDSTALSEYAQATSNMRAAMLRLEALASPDPEALDLAHHVILNAAAVLRDSDGIETLLRHGHLRDAPFLMARPAYLNDAEALQASVRAFVAADRRTQQSQFAAFQSLWSTSILLLLLTVAALAIASTLLLHYSGSAVRGIFELRDKRERFRLHEPLGSRSQRRDEIGFLDAAFHDFADIQEQRESQLEHYRLLSEITQDIILFLDRGDMTIIDANASALKAHGYERSELLGKPLQLLRADDVPIEPALLARVDTLEGAVFERLHRRADGTDFPLEIYARAADIHGRRMILITARDITERRHAAEQVSLAQQRYHLLANVTSDLILFIDRIDLTIVDANAAAFAAYGYEGVEFIGKPVAILRPFEQPFDPEQLAFADTPAGSSYEAMHQRADGTLFPVEVHAHTADVNGRLTIVATIREISERRQAAEQVSLALDQAVEASRLKGEFVATMSHEIRTPMHGVIGMSELLLKRPLGPVEREYAATLKESAQALLAIIDDILDFSKLEANRIELEAVAFDPAQLVAGVVNLVRGAASGKGLALHSYASPHVPGAVRGDPTRVRQILINLVGNAVKFTADGAVAVSMSVEREDGNSVVLAFAVSDTGIGVVPEARERLFEAFVQGDSSTTRKFGGSGLGLSISRRLAELMGGRIWLGEHEGPGSTFCFSARFEHSAEVVAAAIPVSDGLRVLVLNNNESVSALNAIEQRRKTCGAGTVNVPRRARILLAEDSALIRRVARFQLQDLHFGVDIVENGEQAVVAVAAGDYELVLMDMRMPEMDGLTATRAIRAAERESGRHIVVIALTANVLEGDREACIDAGMDDFLMKPLQLDALRTTLERWLPERV